MKMRSYSMNVTGLNGNSEVEREKKKVHTCHLQFLLFAFIIKIDDIFMFLLPIVSLYVQ